VIKVIRNLGKIYLYLKGLKGHSLSIFIPCDLNQLTPDHRHHTFYGHIHGKKYLSTYCRLLVRFQSRIVGAVRSSLNIIDEVHVDDDDNDKLITQIQTEGNISFIICHNYHNTASNFKESNL
jgi:hypothetical protein